MSAVAVTGGWRVVAALGRREALRLTRHPLVLAGAILATATALESLSEHEPLYDYQNLTMLHSFAMGPLVIVAAHLTARRDDRAGMRQAVAAAPATERHRSAGVLCAAVGPALLAAALVAATVALYRLLDADPLWWPGTAELAVQPVRLLGAGLLGVMTARWLPGRVRPVMVVGLVAAAMVLVGRSGNTTLKSTINALFVFNDLHQRWFSVYWHLGYLSCLSAMAAVGALLGTPGPRRALLAVGAVSVAAAALTGWAQLP
jgi:hypothetical protein